MGFDELTKDIVVAMIERGRLLDVSDVCDAYKQIIRTVNDPFSDPDESEESTK